MAVIELTNAGTQNFKCHNLYTQRLETRWRLFIPILLTLQCSAPHLSKLLQNISGVVFDTQRTWTESHDTKTI